MLFYLCHILLNITDICSWTISSFLFPSNLWDYQLLRNVEFLLPIPEDLTRFRENVERYYVMELPMYKRRKFPLMKPRICMQCTVYFWDLMETSSGTDIYNPCRVGALAYVCELGSYFIKLLVVAFPFSLAETTLFWQLWTVTLIVHAA